MTYELSLRQPEQMCEIVLKRMIDGNPPLTNALDGGVSQPLNIKPF